MNIAERNRLFNIEIMDEGFNVDERVCIVGTAIKDIRERFSDLLEGMSVVTTVNKKDHFEDLIDLRSALENRPGAVSIRIWDGSKYTTLAVIGAGVTQEATLRRVYRGFAYKYFKTNNMYRKMLLNPIREFFNDATAVMRSEDPTEDGLAMLSNRFFKEFGIKTKTKHEIVKSSYSSGHYPCTSIMSPELNSSTSVMFFKQETPMQRIEAALEEFYAKNAMQLFRMLLEHQKCTPIKGNEDA